jgi:hypothetical protein
MTVGVTVGMQQWAPYPRELDDLVNRLEYRPGWRFAMYQLERDPADTHGDSAGGLTLVVHADVMDAYQPGMNRPVKHYFAVPAATYDRETWLRWLLDCVLKVEQHEACEWFAVGGERPYGPNHGPGSGQ